MLGRRLGVASRGQGYQNAGLNLRSITRSFSSRGSSWVCRRITAIGSLGASAAELSGDFSKLRFPDPTTPRSYAAGTNWVCGEEDPDPHSPDLEREYNWTHGDSHEKHIG